MSSACIADLFIDGADSVDKPTLQTAAARMKPNRNGDDDSSHRPMNRRDRRTPAIMVAFIGRRSRQSPLPGNGNYATGGNSRMRGAAPAGDEKSGTLLTSLISKARSLFFDRHQHPLLQHLQVCHRYSGPDPKAKGSVVVANPLSSTKGVIKCLSVCRLSVLPG